MAPSRARRFVPRRASSPSSSTLPPHCVRIQATDLDRTGRVPWWSWARIIQDFRVAWFTDAWEELGVSRVVVRSQGLWMNPDVYLSMNDVLHVTTRMGRVGRSSFETLVELRAMPNETGPPGEMTVMCICVMVAIGDDGRSCPLGPRAAAMASPEAFPLHPLVEESRSLRQTADALATADESAVFRMAQEIRYSDEDTNLHVNHANYFRYFDDAVVTVTDGDRPATVACPPIPDGLVRRLQTPAAAVVIEYAREASRYTSPYEVVLEPSTGDFPATVDGYLIKAGTIYSRVRYYHELPGPRPAAAKTSKL